jgi:integrase
LASSDYWKVQALSRNPLKSKLWRPSGNRHRTTGGPFTPTNVRKRGLVAWAKENKKRAEKELSLLNPIGLHELRQTAISVWFAPGVRREIAEHWAGHSSGKVTDIYRHTLSGQFEGEPERADEHLGSTLKVPPPSHSSPLLPLRRGQGQRTPGT